MTLAGLLAKAPDCEASLRRVRVITVDTSTTPVRSVRFCTHWKRTEDPRDVEMCSEVAWLDVAGAASCIDHGVERLGKALAASMGEGPRP